jgi:hypothetical protein
MSASTTQRPVVWISRRTIVIYAILVIAITGALIAFIARPNPDALIVEPAKRVARALATQDAYVNPDTIKSDLSWAAYQQLIALAPAYRDQAQRDPRSFVRFGSVILLDQGMFDDSVTALVQVIVKENNSPTLYEFQIQMVPDGQTWKASQNVTTLLKGQVKAAAKEAK